ncbi:hypothetical protein [Kushneria phosphatilytica]|uniref:Uncharacterized protein n=1 Tax=Kushneria phosphatilytica TaxID=657387 RepID=A0A1S1P289_9GAMM|nr:hypothetical protein [Kushneria phosphatilytica]OHV12900.1 hypothetical protein BH688_02490 [Kushneria phosphatilytica]QEL10761.1 hypothetical protein FY550_06255 [Kushneria phosphatilytica]
MSSLSIRNTTNVFPALLMLALLGGCAGQQPQSPAHDASFYQHRHPDIRLDYKASLERVAPDTGSYFGSHGWNSFVSSDSPGKRLLTLQLPESDDISRAQWRLGISHDSMAVYRCLAPAESATSNSEGTATIDGHRFITFKANEAGMNHYRTIHAYRSVIDGTCYAIDLVVEGVNGKVYDPPRKPPFSQAQALKRLQQINDKLQLEEH